MAIEGSASIEIDAPIERVFEVAADVENSPKWQPEIKVAECLERDPDGNQILVRTETDAKVRTLNSTLDFSYDEPTGLAWTQREGDLKSVDGNWKLEDIGDQRTRATYSMTVDLGPHAGHGDPRPARRSDAKTAGRHHAREAQDLRRGLVDTPNLGTPD